MQKPTQRHAKIQACCSQNDAARKETWVFLLVTHGTADHDVSCIRVGRASFPIKVKLASCQMDCWWPAMQGLHAKAETEEGEPHAAETLWPGFATDVFWQVCAL